MDIRNKAIVFTAISLSTLSLISCGNNNATFSQTTSPEMNGSLSGQQGSSDSSAKTKDEISAVPVPPLGIKVIEREFESAAVKQAATDFDLGTSEVSSQLTLTSLYTSQTLSANQLTRANITDTFVQGSSGSTHTETLVLNQANPIDILVVIDNSGSMAQEQVNLGSKLSPLISAVSAADWRIAVVTTDPANGCQRALIKKSDANASAAFESALNAGTSGNGNERGILMSVVGLSASFPAGVTGVCSPTAQWLRPNAPLAVLIVSDEDNCSTGTGCGTDPWNTSDYLLNHLKSIRTPGVDARVYGLIYHPSQTATTCSTGASKANQYAKIIDETKGIWGSICAADYTNVLQQISLNAASLLKSQYSLSFVPDAPSIKVKLNDVEQTTGWSSSGQTLTFDTPPALGVTLTISYTVGVRPILSRFKLSYPVLPSTLRVQENGADVSASKYSLDTASNELVYKPAESAELRASYKAATPDLLKVFLLGSAPIKAGSLSVKINGTTSSAWTFDSSSNSVTFATAPEEGAAILFAFESLSSKVLDYPFTLPAGVDPATIVVTDASTQALVPATFSAGKISIDPSHHIEGRVLKVTYKTVRAADGWKIPLAQTPLAGSIVVTTASATCPTASYGFSNGFLSILCDTSGGNAFHIAYQYATKSLTEVEITEATQPDLATWTVLINGQTAKEGVDFVREGKRVFFKKEHAPNTKIKIIVNYNVG